MAVDTEGKRGPNPAITRAGPAGCASISTMLPEAAWLRDEGGTERLSAAVFSTRNIDVKKPMYSTSYPVLYLAFTKITGTTTNTADFNVISKVELATVSEYLLNAESYIITY